MQKFLNKYFWAIVIILFIVSRLATWFYPFDSDHWIFYYVGKIWAQGGALYVDAWDHKPPLIFAFNGLMSLVFGGNIIWHRIVFTILAILDTFLFWKLLKIIVPKLNLRNDNLAAKIGLILYVIWRNLSQFTSSGNNTENLGIIFAILTYLTFFQFKDNKKLLSLFISGICLSVLFFLKGNFILLSLPIFIDFIWSNYKNIKKIFIYGLTFVAPLVIQGLLWIFYFKSHGTLHDFWVASFEFSAKYSRSAWQGEISPRGTFLLILSPLIVNLFFFGGKFLLDIKSNIKNYAYRFLFFILLASLVLGFALGTFYPYYFLILLPGFIVIFIYSLDKFLESKLKIIAIALLILTTLISLGFSYKQLYNSFSGSVRAQLDEYKSIASYIDEKSAPSDKIIFYDYGAVMYRLTERGSASRFVSASVLLEDYKNNFGFDFNGIFIAEIQKNKPKYLVMPKDPENIYYQNKTTVDFFKSNFTVEKTFSDYLVLKYIH